ncbi:hypothetical protein FACS189485_18060 [Spirochaetia bacterium]|nr:hypothetical protein FACS189485_18060 [Spirochaetia bacterium]
MFNRVSIYFSMYAIITYTYLFSVINFNKLKDLFLIYVCAIMVFFGAPYVKHITETGHKAHFEPYYNVLEHPYKAQFRRDWNEE